MTRQGDSSAPSCLPAHRGRIFQQRLHFFQLLWIHLLVPEEIHHELLARPVEEAREELSQRTAPRLCAIDDRRVRERAPVFLVTHVPLPLQDAQQGEDRVVRRTRGAIEPFNDLPRVVSGELPLTEWKARCHAIGIAGRPLGPSKPAVN